MLDDVGGSLPTVCFRSARNLDYVKLLRQCEFGHPASESAPSGRLATLNSLQGPTASRPVREFRTSGVMCVGGLFKFSIVRNSPLSIERRPEVQGVASLSSTAAGILRDFFKSSSGALYFKKSLRRQGIGFRRWFFLIVRIRSLDVSGIAEDDGSFRHRPLPQCLSGRGSFTHASQALRPEKRGSPLPMGRTGTDSITLPLHCVRTRPVGKEVRLRLDLFDARFFLSGSVVHFAPDTSSEGKRRRETVIAGVPLLSTPSLPDSQSGIAALSLRSHYAGPVGLPAHSPEDRKNDASASPFPTSYESSGEISTRSNVSA